MIADRAAGLRLSRVARLRAAVSHARMRVHPSPRGPGRRAGPERPRPAPRARARRTTVALGFVVAALTSPLRAGGLAEHERRWLDAAAPVLAEARAQRLPLDVVVQPQPNAGESPVAMAFVDGRCKLVLTARGPGGGALRTEAFDADAPSHVVEAIAAHELAHCWRHAQGTWRAPPAGFAPGRAPAGAAVDLAARIEEMRATRREEGFADLVSLAWTARRHPARYAEVHAWLLGLRGDAEPRGSHYDTAAWLARARDPSVFAGGGSVFERASVPWRDGFRSGED